MTTIAPHQMMILSAARTLSRDLEGRYPIGDYHQSMVTMVTHGTHSFLPGRFPGNHDYQVIWLPPMHSNHGNCRLPGNLPNNHILPLEVVVHIKMDIGTVW
jgi:hypothetical protein